jgi:outer membrane protein TolC
MFGLISTHNRASARTDAAMPGVSAADARRWTRTRMAVLAAAAGAALGLGALGGCADPMDRVDRQIDDLLERRRASLGEDARTVTAAEAARAGTRSSRAERLDPTPTTVNPAAGELPFTPAAAERDIPGRLAAYGAEAFGEASAFDPAVTATEPLVIDFEGALRLAQASGREYQTAEEDYILAAIRLLIEKHRWTPRLFNDTFVGVSGAGVDGRFDHALDIINTLRATQRLPFGGEVEARWVVSAADELRREVTGGYVQSSALVLGANVPLLRGAGSIAREDLIQSERDLVYQARSFERFRRTLLVDVASEYFRLLETRDRIANQERQLESRIRNDEETRAKVDAGRLRPFQRDITANAVRQSQASLANLREQYILQLDRFKIRLGLDPRTPISVTDLAFDVPVPEVTPGAAAERALEYRLDLQNRRDAVLDGERSLENARNGLLPDLDATVDVTIPTGGDDAAQGLDIDPDQTRYSAGVTLSLPLDRKIERLTVRQAQIALERARRGLSEFEDSVVVDARRAVRQIDLAIFQLELAESQIEINRRGLEDLSLRDDADPQSILDRENDLLDAENARDRARTDLRTAILEYLLATGQLRVGEDGTFRALAGMAGSP